jgi:hypothetical protein
MAASSQLWSAAARRRFASRALAPIYRGLLAVIHFVTRRPGTQPASWPSKRGPAPQSRTSSASRPAGPSVSSCSTPGCRWPAPRQGQEKLAHGKAVGKGGTFVSTVSPGRGERNARVDPEPIDGNTFCRPSQGSSASSFLLPLFPSAPALGHLLAPLPGRRVKHPQ